MKTRKSDEDIRLLRGQVSAPHKKLENLEVKLDKKSDILIYDISENKDKDNDGLVTI